MIKLIKIQKFIGVIVLVFGTVFVCTIFGNYYMDLLFADFHLTLQTKLIYDAQLTMSKLIFLLAGGCLGLISLIVVLFSIGRYINENQPAMGVLKAIGYTNTEISAPFMKIGGFLFIGALLGYVCGMLVAPTVYKAMSENTGYTLRLSFHLLIPMVLVLLLTILFSFISFLFAFMKLRKTALNMIRQEIKVKINSKKLTRLKIKTNLPYLKELRKVLLSNHAILKFFVGFASFGFSAQIQLSFSMIGSSMKDSSMTTIVTAICIPIGILLGSVTLLIAGEFIVNSNKQYIAIMKAFGYTNKECNYALLDAYRLPAYIGFLIGTIYQYGLVLFVVSLFSGTYEVEIPFNIISFIGTLVTFMIGYELLMYGYKRRLTQSSLTRIMSDE